MDTILKPNCAMDFWINSTIHCRHLTTVEFNPSCLPLSSLPLSLRALKEMSQELQCIPPPPPTLRSRSRGKKLSFPSHLSYPECSLFRTDLPCNSVPRWVPPPPPPIHCVQQLIKLVFHWLPFGNVIGVQTAKATIWEKGESHQHIRDQRYQRKAEVTCVRLLVLESHFRTSLK